jgi:hypothetical protein
VQRIDPAARMEIEPLQHRAQIDSALAANDFKKALEEEGYAAAA